MIHCDELGRAGRAAEPQTSPHLVEWPLNLQFIASGGAKESETQSQVMFWGGKGNISLPWKNPDAWDQYDVSMVWTDKIKSNKTPFNLKFSFVISNVALLEDFLHIQMNLT